MAYNPTKTRTWDRTTPDDGELFEAEFNRLFDNDAAILAQKGQVDGIATLNGSGKIPDAQLPALAIGDTFSVNNQTAMLALSAQMGDVCVRTDIERTYRLGGTGDPTLIADWIEINTSGALTAHKQAATLDHPDRSVPSSKIAIQAIINELLADGCVDVRALATSIGTFTRGDIKTTTRGILEAGWIWASGKTIGNAASGATERANADTWYLFEAYFYEHTDSILPLQNSSGANIPRSTFATSALAFAGNCRMTIPDLRGRTIVGRDDMGGTSAGRITFAGCGIDGNVLGASGGAQTHTLTIAQLAAHAHTASSNTVGAHGHTVNAHNHGGGNHTHSSANVLGPGANIPYGIATSFNNQLSTIITIPYSGTIIGTESPGTNAAGSHSHTVTITNTGSGSAHNNVQPMIVVNKIIKL